MKGWEKQGGAGGEQESEARGDEWGRRGPGENWWPWGVGLWAWWMVGEGAGQQLRCLAWVEWLWERAAGWRVDAG